MTDAVVDADTFRSTIRGEEGGTLRIRRGDQLLVERTLDGGEEAIELSDLGDGQHTLVITVEDAAGNVSDPRREVVTVDTTPPTDLKIITTGGNADEPLTTITVSVEGADEVSLDLVAPSGIDAVSPPDVASGRATDPLRLLPGVWQLSATARDRAGNVTTATIDHRVDVPAPLPLAVEVNGAVNDGLHTVLVLGPPDGTGELDVSGASHDLAFDATGRVEVRLSDLDDGAYVLTATATDVLGRDAPAGDRVELVVDRTAPELRLTGEAEELDIDLEDGATATLFVSALGDSGMAVDDGPVSLDLPPGTHDVLVVATDAAGNTTEVRHEVTVVSTFAVIVTLLVMLGLVVLALVATVWFVGRRRRSRRLAAPPGAGWYPAPEDDLLDARWDGSGWTDERRPALLDSGRSS